MTISEIEQLAAHDAQMPRGLDVADACLFTGLRLIYRAFKKQTITKKEGKEMKEALIYQYHTDKSLCEFVGREAIKLKYRIADASEAYKNEPTIENADKMYAAFYNLPENWREADG